MIPKSIRWRLPVSYAVIALLAAVALGLLLLTTLRSYYRGQELDYLAGNAQAMGSEINALLEEDFPLSALTSQLAGFAFLSQTQVRFLDPEGNVIADSGAPDETGGDRVVLVEAVSGEAIETENAADSAETGQLVEETSFRSSIVIVSGQISGNIEEQMTITRSESRAVQTVVEETRRQTTAQRYISRLPVTGTPYGFGLSPDAVTEGPRSNLVVRQAIHDSAGKLLGHVELSQGPAYGRDILTSVAWGWAIASGAAVALAAIVGWFVSLRLSTPLLALTEVTGRMAEGQLSARAEISRHDELGTLSRSFNRMATQVENTVTALRRFVADAAHELHTPLTALRTDLELIETGESGTDRTNRIERARTQVARLEALTSGLLDLSRLEANAAIAAHDVIDLIQLLQSVGEPYASRAEQAGLSFALDMPKEGIFVQGNAAQLQQAVSNLLDNAVKYTLEGGRVEVGARATGNWASITVADTGIGIPEADMHGLFGRFHRGRNASTYPGSGLGLAIVKAIVEGHGGRVGVESDKNGSRFTVELPGRAP
jgi:signal transduction histidine kinase